MRSQWRRRKARAAAREERIRRRTRKVRVSVVSQIWSDEGRTLEAVLEKIDEAGARRCRHRLAPDGVREDGGRADSGPISQAICGLRRKAQDLGRWQHPREGGEGFRHILPVQPRRPDRRKYRKSHKLPDETMDLGDDLPVFQTDFGKIAMRIGSDRFFPDIDHVYTVKGASLIPLGTAAGACGG